MHKQVVVATCKQKTLQDYMHTPDEAKGSSKDFLTYLGARGPRVGTDLPAVNSNYRVVMSVRLSECVV